ncbi:MAG: hypothetical protein AAGD01_03355 [Acidobacteriota bacterium]
MFHLKKFMRGKYSRMNAISNSLAGHINGWINLIGSATLPFPEVCSAYQLPGTGCRIEGHLGKRIFPQTQPLDLVEETITERVRALLNLGVSYDVSGQLHSATQANQAIYYIAHKGKALGLSPRDGGHISHSLALPTGLEFSPIPTNNGEISYQQLEDYIEDVDASIVVVGGTSHSRAVDYQRLRRIADSRGAHLHADLAHTAPFIASGIHPPAFPFVDSATLDTGKNLRGPRGGILIYRNVLSKKVLRAIFPVIQSSPDQNAMIAKACCLLSWNRNSLSIYAHRMLTLSRILEDQLCRDPEIQVAFNGTDCHLLVLDLRKTGLSGKAAEEKLESQSILVNRNQVPDDLQNPWIGSGIRLSSTTLAILGYTDQDAAALGSAIADILRRSDAYSTPHPTIAHLIKKYHNNLVNISSELRAE